MNGCWPAGTAQSVTKHKARTQSTTDATGSDNRKKNRNRTLCDICIFGRGFGLLGSGEESPGLVTGTAPDQFVLPALGE